MTAIGLELSLRRRGEKLDIEELISGAPVERLGKALLPRGSRLDIGRAGGSAGLAPVE
jgi:hypothetical protein